MMEYPAGMVAVTRLSRDLRASAAQLGPKEARYLVDAYYQMQDSRIRAAAQLREQLKGGEPAGVTAWLFEQNRVLEQQVKGALARYAEGHEVGRWMLGITGVGPVISAGLLAHLDVEDTQYVSRWYAFAGLTPDTKRPKKGEKRTYNASLKVLVAFKLGESFVKVQSREGDFYGAVYARRKALEVSRNEGGEFADQAAKALERFSYKKDTKARKLYEAGRLPPAHLHARARRYVAKLFLAHLFEVWFALQYGERPELPWVLEHGGHPAASYIAPPSIPSRIQHLWR